MLPRDTPKYNGTAKPEDWLTDYTTTIGIIGANHCLAVRYAPLMLQGSARTWLNSLPMGSINAWFDFEEAFVRNFTGTYKRPGRPSQLAMCVQAPRRPVASTSPGGPSSETAARASMKSRRSSTSSVGAEMAPSSSTSSYAPS